MLNRVENRHSRRGLLHWFNDPTRRVKMSGGGDNIAVVDVLEKRLAMATNDFRSDNRYPMGRKKILSRAASSSPTIWAPVLCLKPLVPPSLLSSAVSGHARREDHDCRHCRGDSAINFLKINREVSIGAVFRYANRYPVTMMPSLERAFR